MRSSLTITLALVMGSAFAQSCSKKPNKEVPAKAAAPSKPEPAPAVKKEAAAPKQAPKKTHSCLASLQPATTFIPGTVVSISPPTGYAPAKYFPGYERNAGKQTIVVSEFPMPLSKASAALKNDAIWARQGMTLVSNEELVNTAPGQTLGCRGTLLEVKEPSGDKPVRKFVWLFGDEKQSFQIMGNCAEPCAEADAAAIRKAVQTARWNPKREPQRWDRMSFSLDPSPLKALPGGARAGYLRSYTSDGQSDTKGEKSVFLFGPAFEAPEEKTASFAEKTLERRPVRDVQIKKKSKTKKFGLKGWTLQGTGKSMSGAEQWFSYTVLFDEKTYWSGLGMCPVGKKASCKPIFEKILSTVKLQDAI